MNKNIIVTIALLLMALAGFVSADTKSVAVSPLAPWQNSSNIKAIDPDNPDREIVETEIQAITSGYKKPAYNPPHIWQPLQIATPALTRLFPNYRFYIISWNISPANTPEGRMVSVPGLLYFTLVIPAKGEPLKMGGYGNYEDFGKLLHMNGVKLKSTDDAKLIWTAFNDAYQKQWFAQETPRQVSPTEWALHENRIDNFKYWYRITLDDKKTVTSAKLMAEEIKKQSPPK